MLLLFQSSCVVVLYSWDWEKQAVVKSDFAWSHPRLTFHSHTPEWQLKFSCFLVGLKVIYSFLLLGVLWNSVCRLVNSAWCSKTAFYFSSQDRLIVSQWLVCIRPYWQQFLQIYLFKFNRLSSGIIVLMVALITKHWNLKHLTKCPEINMTSVWSYYGHVIVLFKYNVLFMTVLHTCWQCWPWFDLL